MTATTTLNSTSVFLTPNWMPTPKAGVMKEPAFARIARICKQKTEEIKPYLVQFPFTYRNIGLRILFYSDAKYEPTLDPNICCISLDDGIISYEIADAQNRFTNKSVEKESYEDALKIQNRMN